MFLFKHPPEAVPSDDPFSVPSANGSRPRHFSRSQLRPYSPEEILTLVQLNEITNIEIANRRKTARIGACTGTDSLSGAHGAKQYYVEDRRYSDLSLFRRALDPYIKDGVVSVLSVDGVMAAKLK